MYFLTDEERKQLLKNYLPRSRQSEIADELRGWNWNQPPLEPVYDLKLALYEIANAYCPTNRDLFLRRVDGIKSQSNAAMLRGKILHQALVDILVKAKKLIYMHGVTNYQKVLQELSRPTKINLVQYRGQLAEEDLANLVGEAEMLTSFEASRIISRIQEILIKQPYIAEDSLAALVIPIVVEQKLDGSFLGLSQNLSADAFTFSEPMIIDLKFGEPQKFHRLTTTGYALVMEAIYEFPVNLGCLVYASIKNGRLSVKKDIHIIDDELRQWFIEERDEKMRMIYEEIDPGIANNCYGTCPNYHSCHG
ncbi:type I-A CRISPR-associated protein Cas4/Csa1 [Desulfotruncus alcoholivorax]|uniref:type I-A CRISPR-associated protein Cas4/Csa1 n=1 Tax=Desulfotruncus alcoholivorax TaxID=265477 RepID=UPI00048483C9|nr:type I-A CRISPR-associated protein Cas4/Csa1 [Desulfotruncus alcoholivorax]